MTVVWTADRVGITDGLRVWVLPRAEPGLYVWALPHEPGTVDLTTAVTPAGRDPVVRVDLDFGRSVIVTAAMLAACHPRTGQRPPGLGICRWVGTCADRADRGRGDRAGGVRLAEPELFVHGEGAERLNAEVEVVELGELAGAARVVNLHLPV